MDILKLLFYYSGGKSNTPVDQCSIPFSDNLGSIPLGFEGTIINGGSRLQSTTWTPTQCKAHNATIVESRSHHGTLSGSRTREVFEIRSKSATCVILALFETSKNWTKSDITLEAFSTLERNRHSPSRFKEGNWSRYMLPMNDDDDRWAI